ALEGTRQVVRRIEGGDQDADGCGIQFLDLIVSKPTPWTRSQGVFHSGSNGEAGARAGCRPAPYRSARTGRISRSGQALGVSPSGAPPATTGSRGTPTASRRVGSRTVYRARTSRTVSRSPSI